MRIQIKSRLKLNKILNTLVLKYNTFEKITWDLYLVTSLSLHAKNDKEALQYIEEITGNGSLRKHFEKLYFEVKKLSTDDKKRYISQNVFPILKTDIKNKYEYYPDLKVSVLNNKIHKGDIALDKNLHKSLIDDIEAQFHSSEILEEKIKEDSNIYKVIIDPERILVEISKNCEIEISEEQFLKLAENDIIEPENFRGKINFNPTANNWNILTKSFLNNIQDNEMTYYNEGLQYRITNEGIKEVELAALYGIYIYSERLINYKSTNKDIIEKAVKSLLNNGNINVVKTKILVSMLKVINYDLAQEAINYILDRKSSSEVSTVGLEILKKGLEKKWSKEALINIKKVSKDPNELVCLYRTDETLDFNINELLQITFIDKTLLNKEHSNRVKNYYQNEEEVRNTINILLGIISSSAIRERSKKLVNTDDVAKFRKQANNYIAHSDKNIKNYTGEKLINYESQVRTFYNLYLKIEKMLSNQNK